MKKGDAVEFEYRDTYDRETGIRIIVDIKEGNYRVCLIQSEKGKWFWTNYEEWKSVGRLTKLGKTAKDYDLEV